MKTHQVDKVISGDQIRIDGMGLGIARTLGISTGGIAHKGYLTENGLGESLRNFGLIEHSSAKYPPRTKANVIQSNGTALFGNVTTEVPNRRWTSASGKTSPASSTR